MMGKTLRAVALVVLVVAGAACEDADTDAADSTLAGDEETQAPATPEAAAEGPLEVSRSDFGDDWPLTVERGTLACEEPSAVIFTTGGTTYAVNGMASGLADQRGWEAEIDPIWAEGEAAPRKNIGPLIDRGLELCE